jgi:hypothetical protein
MERDYLKYNMSVLEDQKLLMPPSLKLLFSLADSSRFPPATERYEVIDRGKTGSILPVFADE